MSADNDADVRSRAGETDALTGLPSRAAFLSALDHLFAQPVDRCRGITLLVVDVQGFRRINGTCGLRAGDDALVTCSRWIRSACRAGDHAGRVGGDQFAMLLPDIFGEEHALLAAYKLLALSEGSADDTEEGVMIRLNVGMALSSPSLSGAEELFLNAMDALSQAKQGKDNPVVFRPESASGEHYDTMLLSSLKRAIGKAQIGLAFQAKKQLRTNRICGAEALIRWEHPDRGLVHPGDTIRLARTSGRLEELTLWIVDQSLRACAAWHAKGFDMSVSVNMESDTFASSHIPEQLADSLELWRVPPSSLVVELTEGTLMSREGRVHDNVQRLGELGVGIAIDDFGTGYSSLAYLSELQVDELKIDKRFIDSIDTATRDFKLVETIVHLGRGLGLSVTAEGVERDSQLELLRQIDCDVVQGYLVSRPVDGSAFEKFLESAPK